MAGKYIVQPGQSLIDCCISATGTAESCMLIARANSMAISDSVVPGSELVIPDGVPVDKGVLRYWLEHDVVPGTKGTVPLPLGGEEGEGLIGEGGEILTTE